MARASRSASSSSRRSRRPGHCNGHYCLRLVGRDRTYLFSSDCVFWGGAIILQNVPDSNVQRYAASCNRIAELEFDALLPGHHLISLRTGAVTRRRRRASSTGSVFREIYSVSGLRRKEFVDEHGHAQRQRQAESERGASLDPMPDPRRSVIEGDPQASASDPLEVG